MEAQPPTLEDPRIAALQQEIAALRRRGRITLVLAAAGIAVGVLTLVSRSLPVRELTASRWTLVDSLGRTRASMETAESGPVLSLFAADETPRARLSVSGQVGVLTFLDAEGGQRALLSGRPGLMLSDTARTRLSLEVGVDGPAVELVDGQGFATLHPVDGLKMYGGSGALAAALEPGAFSLYTATEGPDSQLSVSLAAPRRPGERVRLLLYDGTGAPSFAAP